MKNIMHLSKIAVGIIYASNMFKKTRKNSFYEVGIPGIIEVKHSLPGRIRVYVPYIMEQGDLEAMICKMESVEAIKSMSANRHTGSILVNYDENQVSSEIIIGAIIKLLGLEHHIDEVKNPLVLKEIKKFNQALNFSVYETTNGLVDFKTLLPLIFVFVGARKIYMQKGSLGPNPYSLLYWAYKALLK